MRFLSLVFLILCLSFGYSLNAQDSFISFEPTKDAFALYDGNEVPNLIVSNDDFDGVKRVTTHLQSDLKTVTSSRPEIYNEIPSKASEIIIIGTLGESPLIQQLIDSGKLKLEDLQGKREKHIITTIKNPFKNIDKALVIAGSDKRGTIYGMYDLSREIGVSPWYYWADVPIIQQAKLYVKSGVFTQGEPSVKYRGIFINDEAPALRSWAEEKFGGFNHQFYEKVYELILRNKGNYLWPAMWRPTAFADDDPENASLADEYGVIISTSHHEPMMRAHDEWSRHGEGEWNYNANKVKLQDFWKSGIERMGDYESVVTVGMRGDGDEAMGEDTAVGLLKEIITDQRRIIADVTGKPAQETPQVWALYKEVQDYYDKGMRVDDDIMILYCDDNWGNVRILPKKEDLNYKGGFGMYYHFDFVGGPVSYRWLNVTQIEKVWEQMNLSYQWGVKDLWIVNVGDIKPMELPISFFLDFAWNASMKAEELPNYYTKWAKQQFGNHYTTEIANIMSLYTKYNARRTPEMLKPDTYSLHNYNEAETVLAEYQILLSQANKIYNNLPEEYKSAFYQLVLFPVEASSNLNEMYIAAGKNKLYESQGRASTNYYADKVKELFFKDAELTKEYHEDLENGKWNHMMAQTHIGYTYWNNPPVNKMPEISYIQPQANAELGYVIEQGIPLKRKGFSIERGDFNMSSGLYSKSFSTFDPINNQSYSVEIFNRGKDNLDYTLSTKNDWITISSKKGSVQYEEKINVSIDWDKAPQDNTTGEIIISGAGREFTVQVPIRRDLPKTSGFVENNGVVSFEASNFSKKHNSSDIAWLTVPNLGRTGDAITVSPANAAVQVPSENSPYLEYEFTILDEKEVNVHAYLSPTLNYKKNDGLKYAIAIDNEKPQLININDGEIVPDWEYPEWWNNSVTDHIKIKQSQHGVLKPGKHTLKVWMVDPGIVFQKFVIDLGGLKPSYLGPQESLKN